MDDLAPSDCRSINPSSVQSPPEVFDFAAQFTPEKKKSISSTGLPACLHQRAAFEGFGMFDGGI